MTSPDTPRERPIIFSSPMVRAILAGRKTMTRRLLTSPLRKCEPGDLLWVRESLKARNMDLLGAFGLAEPLTEVDMTRGDLCISYAADDEPAVEAHGFDLAWLWKRPAVPAIHMPRSVCRLLLKITAVKIEHLQDITDADAMAEGALESGLPYVGAMTCDQARVAFSLLWDSLHGKLSWEQNQEVVAISFERINPKGGDDATTG